MKLTELIHALADEVENVIPDLENALAVMERDDPASAAFADALDQYSWQTQRLSEAAEVSGLSGLQAACSHVMENMLMLSAAEPEERAGYADFLRGWPPKLVHYLRNFEQAEPAIALVSHLRSAPIALDDHAALQVMYDLSSASGQMSGGDATAQASRPVLAAPEDVELSIPQDVEQNVIDGFFHETPDSVRTLLELVRRMAAGAAEPDDITTAKRISHTLKGSGATMGLRGISALGHHFEDILEHFEDTGSEVAKPVADVLLDAAFCLEQMVGFVMGTDEFPQQAQYVLQTVLDTANRIDRGESMDVAIPRAASPHGATLPATGEGVAASAVQTPAAAAQPAGATSSTATTGAALRVGMDRIEEMFRVSGEISVHTAAMETRIKQLADRSRHLLSLNMRLQKRLFEMETLVDVRSLTMLRGRGGRSEEGVLDPLEMEQYSELHSTTHALLEEAADVRTISQRFENDVADLGTLQTRQELLSRDLQHLVIGTRMTEVGVLESRLQRNIRTTCQMTGKQATLRMTGGETLVDSDVLTRLAEPLLHLLRNAVDHGLESPDVRAANGKSSTGEVQLDFFRQGQQVVLQCRDDGRGLDIEGIRRRAIERGLIAADQPVSVDDAARLILSPGFTTRDAVSEISGRGVGLDVVRDWVQGMNGSIRVLTEDRQGTTFELRFPASLSTIQSLIVSASDHFYALPSVQVVQAIARGIGQFEELDDQLIYHHGDKTLIAYTLSGLVGLPLDAARPLDTLDAVIVFVNDMEVVLAVDALLDSRELLVKNPGRYARHVPGVLGLSILGDGSIAVNLDLVQLLDAAAGGHAAAYARKARDGESMDRKSRVSVLIVDDSLSVRNSLQQLVSDAGFHAETARDGIEAVNALVSFTPDLILTDLEMPNMNGIELTSHVRSRADIANLPVVMITSRSQEKHRRMAEQAGISAYLTKPYSDVDVIRTIREALAHD